MDMKEFSRLNALRCNQGFNHEIEDWTLSDWFTATLGELGEAANVAKKLNRNRDGIKGNKESPTELRWKLEQEIADTVIYLDLLAQSQGIDLTHVVRRTFNLKSLEIGSDVMID